MHPDGGNPVVVFQKGARREGGLHQWVDLSPWVGQKITVRFALNQAQRSPQLTAEIDDVSVGSWTTPVIQSISPNRMLLPFPASTLITIQGENFMGSAATPPVVKLNGQPVAVTWVNDHRLQFSIPSSQALGIYDL